MPKITSKNGYNFIEATGGEKTSQFLQNFLASAIQGFAAKKQKEVDTLDKARNVTADQAKFRIMLGDLRSSSPDVYNEVVQDPSIQAFMDPDAAANLVKKSVGDKKFQQFLKEGKITKGGQKLEAKPLTPEEQAKKDAVIASGKATVSNAGTQINANQLQDLVTNWRTGKMKAEDALSQIEGLTGKPSDVNDMQSAFYKAHPEALAAVTPGTLENKQANARKLEGQMIQDFKVTDPTAMAQIRARANYEMGLTDTPPAAMPDSYKGIELKLQQDAQKLREKQFGFDQVQYQASQAKSALDVAHTLSNYGLDPQTALQLAPGYLKTGKLPPGVTLQEDKVQKIEEETKGVQLDYLKQELKKSLATDPEMERLLQVARTIPGKDRDDSPVMKQIYKKLGMPEAQVAPGMGAWIMQGINAVMTKSSFGPGYGSTTTPASPQATESWSPELEMDATTAFSGASQAYTLLSPTDRGLAESAMQDLADASKTKDVGKAKQAIADLKKLLGKK